MKIQNLIEAKFSPSSYAYHVTNIDHLRSILKHGLIPNKSASSGYGSSEVSSYFGYELSALPGVYFTTSMDHAEHIAKQIDGSGLIIIAKIQKRDSSMDEDQLTGHIIDEPELIKKIRMNSTIISKNPSMFVDRVVDDILKSKFVKQLNQKLISNVIPDLKKYVELLVKMQGTSELEHWSSTEWNAAIKPLQMSLTKKFKNILHNSENKLDTFKIDGSVGYSGANKIVGFFNFLTGTGYGILGDFERDAYHKVKSPMDLVKH